MFVALQETLEVAYNNELAEKASKKGLRREKDLKLFCRFGSERK
jgi:hypothetical protein